MSISIQTCTDCETRLFPARLRCPACGGAALVVTEATTAVVEQATTLADGTVLATVRETTVRAARSEGPAIVARLTGAVRPGDTVLLTGDPGAGPGHAYVPGSPTRGATENDPSRDDGAPSPEEDER